MLEDFKGKLEIQTKKKIFVLIGPQILKIYETQTKNLEN
jgi:hypothetical protein